MAILKSEKSLEQRSRLQHGTECTAGCSRSLTSRFGSCTLWPIQTACLRVPGEYSAITLRVAVGFGVPLESGRTEISWVDFRMPRCYEILQSYRATNARSANEFCFQIGPVLRWFFIRSRKLLMYEIMNDTQESWWLKNEPGGLGKANSKSDDVGGGLDWVIVILVRDLKSAISDSETWEMKHWGIRQHSWSSPGGSPRSNRTESSAFYFTESMKIG